MPLPIDITPAFIKSRHRVAMALLAVSAAVGALVAVCHPAPAGAAPLPKQALWASCNDQSSSVILLLDAGSLEDAHWPGGTGVTLHRVLAQSVGEALSKVGVLGLVTGSDESPTSATKRFYIAGRSGLFRACHGHGYIGPVWLDWFGPDYQTILESWPRSRGIDLIARTEWGPLYRVWHVGHIPR